MIKKEQLKNAMKYYLTSFNDEEVEISDSTVHKDVLSEDDGFGPANSKRMYKDAVRWTLYKKNHQIKAWPMGWMDKTVEELANEIY